MGLRGMKKSDEAGGWSGVKTVKLVEQFGGSEGREGESDAVCG